MDALRALLEFVANNILGQVPILIGLIVLVGLLLQRKSFRETIEGTVRAALGVQILFIGVGVFVAGLVAFQTIVSSAFRLTPPTSTNTLADFLAQRGGDITLIITVGFFFHLILVAVLRRLFNVGFVYLTGHLMFWISVVVAAVFVEVFPAVDTLTIVLVGGLVVAVYWTIQPLYIDRFMRRVTGHDQFGYGHTSSSAAWLAGALGRFVGDPEKHDSEKIKLPDSLAFFKDINVSTFVVITVIMLLAAIFADPKVVADEAAKENANLNPYLWTLIAGLKFAGGIAILLFGVRMFLAEMVPAFKGISDRLIPGARPALDVPVVFPYAPTAVMIGFLSGTVVFLILMGIFGAAGIATIVPPMIMLFFPGGGAGVFGNAFGGWRGAVLGGAINGLFLAVGQAITWGMLSNTAPELATLADPDWYIITWILLPVLLAVKAVVGG
jgi:PTS system ascorbate-specific IIC component